MMDPSTSGNLTFSSSSCLVTFPGGFPGTNINVASTIAYCAVNIFTSFVATTANLFVMWAIKETPSLRTPSAVFLFILALSDFAVGVFVQPLSVIHLIGAVTRNVSLHCISGSILYPLGCALVFVSLMTITAISFDRYLALALHLRYASIITINRVIKFNLLEFGVLVPLSFYFWFSKIDWLRKTLLYMVFILGTIGITGVVISYCQIFTILRRHKKQIQSQNQVATRLRGFSESDIFKYKKSVLTVLYVLGAIGLSYLPFGISFVTMFSLETQETKHVLFITGIMVLLNSSINPLFYCWRITEIRRFVISKLRRIFRVSGHPHDSIRVERVKPVNE